MTTLTELRKLAEEAKRLDVTCPVRHALLLSLLDLVDEMAEALAEAGVSLSTVTLVYSDKFCQTTTDQISKSFDMMTKTLSKYQAMKGGNGHVDQIKD